MKLLAYIKEWLGHNNPSLEEVFMSQSVSLEDVERRLKMIERGSASFQQRY